MQTFIIRALFLFLAATALTSSAEAQSFLGTSADLALGFYQQFMSPVRSSAGKCQFSPSCSQYAKDAAKEQGFFIGTLMAGDRLMRCGVHAARSEYPHDGNLFSDPPSKNYLFGNGGLWKLSYAQSVRRGETEPPIRKDLRFAYSLFLDGDHDYSVMELKRLQANTDSSEEKNYIHTLVAANQFAHRDLARARTAIDKVEPETLDDLHRGNTFILDYLIADAQELDLWNAARAREMARSSDTSRREVYAKLEVFSLTKSEEYDSARVRLAGFMPSASDYVTGVEESGTKSEVLAGIMSAVLPGSGYIYAGKWKEGISALAFNALLGWGIYSLVENDNVGSAILLSSFTLPFYLGNIVGATNAAMSENAKSREIAFGTLRSILQLDFYFSFDFLKHCWQ